MDDDNEHPPLNEPPVDVAGEHDDLLDALVRAVNRLPGTRIPITLLVRGALVTGWITNGGDFLDALGDAMATGMPDEESAQRIRQVYTGASMRYRVPTGDDTNQPPQRPTYIHLADVEIDNGGPVTPSNWWRGRIETIDGWSYGFRRAET
jgi:hypothetical protein